LRSYGDSTTFDFAGAYRLFSFHSNGVVYLNGITLRNTSPFGPDSTIIEHHFNKNAVNMLARSNEITRWLDSAKTIGKNEANSEIQELFVRSQYFREALANAILEPLAREILIKRQRNKSDQNYYYTLSEFLHDKQAIKTRMDSFHISLPLDSLFSDAAMKIRTGNLLQFYTSYEEFEFQWVIVMFGFTLALLLAIIFDKLDIFISLGMYSRKGLFLMSTAIYAWCWKLRPEGLSFFYWILPFLFIPIVFCLLFYKPPRRNL
jgi:hypothetical protein